MGRASRARLPGILPGSDGDSDTRIVPLARRSVGVSLLGTIVVSCPGQGGAGRPTHYSGSRQSGSRVPREAPRHPAGERWRQRHADRSSRAAISWCLSTRDDRRNLPGTVRRGTPPCIGRDAQPTTVGRAKVGRASRARLPGILPGSDGDNDTRIVPLARRSVGVSLLGTIAVTRPGQGGAGRRPASDGTSNPLGASGETPNPLQWVAPKWVARPARGSPASCRGAMATTTRESYLSRGDQLVSLLGTIVVSRQGQGGAGRRPASDVTSNPLQVGRASRARLPGILPGSDGDNDTRIVPLARRSVGVSLLGTIAVSRQGQGEKVET